MTESEMLKLMRTGANRIDAEKFGSFIAKRRRDRKLTQRELAEKLYISNKAVSKWECGLSLPDIALLEPLADALEVSVTELLHGECMPENTPDSSFTREESAFLMERLEEDAEERRSARKQAIKKRAILYFLCVGISCMELWLLYREGYRFGILADQISMDVLLAVILPMAFGIWFFFFIRERLPGYYDTEKISFYADGFMEMNIPGIYFNNQNWPHILKAGRGYCFLVPILYPALYFVLRLFVPGDVSLWFGPFLQLIVVLTGLFVPITIAARGRRSGDGRKKVRSLQ